jgi:class 3 adenylate cyclase
LVEIWSDKSLRSTAARLQAAANSGEILVSRRVQDLTKEHLPMAESRVLTLKGKSEAEHVVALRADP